jgi:hypothetical protein
MPLIIAVIIIVTIIKIISRFKKSLEIKDYILKKIDLMTM